MPIVINIHHFVHEANETKVEKKLDKIISMLGDLDKVAAQTDRLDKTTDDLEEAVKKINLILNYKNQNRMSETIQNLAAKITRAKTVHASAIALMGGIKTRLDAAIAELAKQNVDNEALNSLSADLGGSTEELATAVVANTDAEDEEPTEDPAPDDTGGDVAPDEPQNKKRK